MLISGVMTQRNNHLQNARQPHAAAAVLRAALPSQLITALAIASALILALVLITGPTSAEYGIA